MRLPGVGPGNIFTSPVTGHEGNLALYSGDEATVAQAASADAGRALPPDTANYQLPLDRPGLSLIAFGPPSVARLQLSLAGESGPWTEEATPIQITAAPGATIAVSFRPVIARGLTEDISVVYGSIRVRQDPQPAAW